MSELLLTLIGFLCIIGIEISFVIILFNFVISMYSFFVKLSILKKLLFMVGLGGLYIVYEVYISNLCSYECSLIYYLIMSRFTDIDIPEPYIYCIKLNNYYNILNK